MSVNKKYLTQSKWQRFAKISAGILGGFLVSTSVHLAFASFVQEDSVLLILSTFSFTVFLVWLPLMLLPFYFENGWKCWLWYVKFIVIFSVIIYVGIIDK